MLKSYFDISNRDSRTIDDEENEESLLSEPKIIKDRRLNKSEISINLSLLGKTANGDGIPEDIEMLVSHFNINYVEEEQVKQKEQPRTQKQEKQEAMEEEEESQYTSRRTVDKRCLNKSEVSIRLSFLGKTANGEGYTYLKAKLTGMNLTSIKAIKSFTHLQFIDLSANNLVLEELQAVTELPYLILLQADKNLLKSAALHKMKYFQVLILNNNEINSVHDIFQPELSTLELGFNNIDKIQFDYKMANMRCLDLRNNIIKDISQLDFPKLDSLYLANNKITSLVGIEKLINLRILHVRNNPIRLLDGFHEDLKKLAYVNLRNCKVSTLKQIKKLRVLKGLETLILKGCPYLGGTGTEDIDAGDEEDDPEARLDVLASLARLKKLNKTVVSPDERDEAKTLMLQWLEEGEKDEEEVEEEINAEEGDEELES